MRDFKFCIGWFSVLIIMTLICAIQVPNAAGQEASIIYGAFTFFYVIGIFVFCKGVKRYKQEQFILANGTAIKGKLVDYKTRVERHTNSEGHHYTEVWLIYVIKYFDETDRIKTLYIESEKEGDFDPEHPIGQTVLLKVIDADGVIEGWSDEMIPKEERLFDNGAPYADTEFTQENTQTRVPYNRTRYTNTRYNQTINTFSNTGRLVKSVVLIVFGAIFFMVGAVSFLFRIVGGLVVLFGIFGIVKYVKTDNKLTEETIQQNKQKGGYTNEETNQEGFAEEVQETDETLQEEKEIVSEEPQEEVAFEEPQEETTFEEPHEEATFEEPQEEIDETIQDRVDKNLEFDKNLYNFDFDKDLYNLEFDDDLYGLKK